MRDVFQRNVFHIRPVPLAAEAYQVLDEQGNPLLDVTSPNRMTRLVMALIRTVPRGLWPGRTPSCPVHSVGLPAALLVGLR